MSLLNLHEFQCLIGKTLAEASRICANVGVVVREIERDGEEVFRPMGINYKRINVCTASGRVRAIDGAY